MKRLKKILRFLLLKLIIRLKAYKLKNAILIFSETRGGSTWLMEILNEIPQTVVNWEPLHVELGVAPPELNFGWRPLIKENDTNPIYLKLFKDIIRFRIYNQWTTKFLTVHSAISSKYVVTKFVRANMLLPWFGKQFKDSFQIKPIFLIRHPIPTCMSQLKTFQNIKGNAQTAPFDHEQAFEKPEGINNDRFDTHIDFISSLNSALERTIAIWCVNNVSIIDHPSKALWNTIFYEELMLNPEEEVMKIIDESDLQIDRDLFKNFDFGKASASNYKGDYKKDTNEQLASFINKFDNEYLQKIQRIFDYFAFSTYNAFSAFPLKKEF